MERLILVNVGLSSISLFGVIIAIFIGIGLVSKEIEKKTLYTILSRPVRRWEFIAGKYLGLLLTLVVNTALMTAGFYLALLIFAQRAQACSRCYASGGNLLHCSAILMMVAHHAAVFYFFIAHFFRHLCFCAVRDWDVWQDLRNFAAISHGATKWLATAAAYMVPNFASLNVISQVAHEQSVSGHLILFNTMYALLYSHCRNGCSRAGF